MSTGLAGWAVPNVWDLPSVSSVLYQKRLDLLKYLSDTSKFSFRFGTTASGVRHVAETVGIQTWSKRRDVVSGTTNRG